MQPPVAADAEGRLRRLLGAAARGRLLPVHARLPLRGVRRRGGRVPDVSAARRGRVPRLPVLISFIIIITSSAFRGSYISSSIS